MTVKEALTEGKRKLDTETALLDAQLILMHAAKENGLSLNKVKLYTEPDLILDEKIVSAYRGYLKRCEAKEPVQYITGSCEFMGLDFSVNRYTLIPRPDTEILAENAIEYIRGSGARKILDLCTGSGAIAVSVASFCPEARVSASDISGNALEIARINADKNGVSDRTEFLEGDLFKPLSGRKFDVILSNPPYIRRGDIDSLSPNVREYEPLTALDGGEDGLIFYKKIAALSKEYFAENGRIYLEIGFDQGTDVCNILNENGFENIKVIKDLSGLDRVVCADI